MNDSADFGSFGRFRETPVSEMSADVRSAYDFTKGLRGLVPGPHRIWLANPTLSKTIVPVGEYYQHHSTLTKAEIEIVTNLVNARWRASYASYEHEKIGQEQGHLDREKLERMIGGLPVSFDEPREDVVYQLSAVLVQPRIVSAGLYHRAIGLIGEAGVVDISVLIGWFTMVCTTLNAFDVPSNATGLDQ